MIGQELGEEEEKEECDLGTSGRKESTFQGEVTGRVEQEFYKWIRWVRGQISPEIKVFLSSGVPSACSLSCHFLP